MALVDTDALRNYLTDYYGTAAFNGFPVAIVDVWDVENATGIRLCEIAEELGIDLTPFVVDDEGSLP